NNYSEPAAPTLLFVDVGAAYDAPPNGVRQAMLAAMSQVPRLLTSPRPEVLLIDFGPSALIHRARFWIPDFSLEEFAKDEVRRACTVLEISAEPFRAYVQARPEVIDHLAAAAAARRRELDQVRATHTDAPALEPTTLVQRMRQFFGIGS